MKAKASGAPPKFAVTSASAVSASRTGAPGGDDGVGDDRPHANAESAVTSDSL